MFLGRRVLGFLQLRALVAGEELGGGEVLDGGEQRPSAVGALGDGGPRVAAAVGAGGARRAAEAVARQPVVIRCHLPELRRSRRPVSLLRLEMSSETSAPCGRTAG